MTNFIDLEAIVQQGPLFWVACVAVALGLAMIAAATVVQTRRLGRKFSPAPTKEETLVVPSVSEKAATVGEPREELRSPVESPKARPNIAREPATQRLEQLLGRLDKVAERLDLAGNLVLVPGETPESAQAVESDLKEEPQGVEYVFRAVGG